MNSNHEKDVGSDPVSRGAEAVAKVCFDQPNCIGWNPDIAVTDLAEGTPLYLSAAQAKTSLTTIETTEDGWSEWQLPIMRGYRMQCCDCGLIHDAEFKATKVLESKPDGSHDCEDLDIHAYRVAFRMRRACAAPSPGAVEQPVVLLSRDDARLKLWQAIEAIKIGNRTDDKLIIEELRKLGVFLCATTSKPAQEPADTAPVQTPTDQIAAAFEAGGFHEVVAPPGLHNWTLFNHGWNAALSSAAQQNTNSDHVASASLSADTRFEALSPYFGVVEEWLRARVGGAEADSLSKAEFWALAELARLGAQSGPAARQDNRPHEKDVAGGAAQGEQEPTYEDQLRNILSRGLTITSAARTIDGYEVTFNHNGEALLTHYGEGVDECKALHRMRKSGQSMVQFTDQWGVQHTMSIERAAFWLKEIYDTWPGGLAEIESALKMAKQS